MQLHRLQLPALAAAAAALLLAGCASVADMPSEEHSNHSGRKMDIVPVVGSIWRATGENPSGQSAPRTADWVYERAQRFCHDRGAGMMPLKGSGDKTKAWLEFRCSAPEKVNVEYQPIKLHFDDLLEDDKKRN